MGRPFNNTAAALLTPQERRRGIQRRGAWGRAMRLWTGTGQANPSSTQGPLHPLTGRPRGQSAWRAGQDKEQPDGDRAKPEEGVGSHRGNPAFRAADFRKSTEKQHPCLEVLGDRQGGSVHQP